MSTANEPESQLREYWHAQLDEVTAPSGLVEKALADALREPAPAVKAPRWSKAVLGAAAAVALGLAVTLSVQLHQNHQSFSALEAGSHRAAQAEVPAGRLAALSQSASARVWTLTWHDGSWQLWRRAGETRWSLAASLAGTSGRQPVLAFRGQNGFLAVPTPQGAWNALMTKDNGLKWTSTALPKESRGYSALAVSAGPSATYVALAGNGSHVSELYRESAKRTGRWIRVKAKELPTAITSVEVGKSGHGSLLADGQVYQTVDGGSQWRPVLSQMGAAMAAAGKAPVAMTLSASVVKMARLEGLTASWGSQEWAVVDGAVWTRKSLGAPWQQVGKVPGSSAPKSLAIGAGGQTAYLLEKSGALYATRNGGRNWKRSRL